MWANYFKMSHFKRSTKLVKMYLLTLCLALLFSLTLEVSHLHSYPGKREYPWGIVCNNSFALSLNYGSSIFIFLPCMPVDGFFQACKRRARVLLSLSAYLVFNLLPRRWGHFQFPTSSSHLRASDTLLWAGMCPPAGFPPVFKLCKVAPSAENSNLFLLGSRQWP